MDKCAEMPSLDPVGSGDLGHLSACWLPHENSEAESLLHLGPSSTRIIVEFPQGYTPPAQGSTVTRDQTRPYEITEVRKQSDGQLNVFVREIMQ